MSNQDNKKYLAASLATALDLETLVKVNQQLGSIMSDVNADPSNAEVWKNHVSWLCSVMEATTLQISEITNGNHHPDSNE